MFVHFREPVPSAGSTPASLTRLAARTEAAAARSWLLVLSLAVYLPLFVLFFGTRLPFSLPTAAAACHGRPILDQRWSYAAGTVAEYLRSCGAAGREAIERQQDADLLYPAMFGLVLTVSFALLLRSAVQPGSPLHLLVLLPAVTTAADYVENIGVRLLLALYPAQPPFIPVLSAVTATKLATGWVCIVVLFGLLIAVAARRAGGRRILAAHRPTTSR